MRGEGRRGPAPHPGDAGSSPATSRPWVRVPQPLGRGFESRQCRAGGVEVPQLPAGSSRRGRAVFGGGIPRGEKIIGRILNGATFGLVGFFFFSPLSFLFCKNQSLFCWSSLKEELGCEELGCELHVLFWKCSCVVWRGLGASHGFSLFTHWP